MLFNFLLFIILSFSLENFILHIDSAKLYFIEENFRTHNTNRHLTILKLIC